MTKKSNKKAVVVTSILIVITILIGVFVTAFKGISHHVHSEQKQAKSTN